MPAKSLSKPVEFWEMESLMMIAEEADDDNDEGRSFKMEHQHFSQKTKYIALTSIILMLVCWRAPSLLAPLVSGPRRQARRVDPNDLVTNIDHLPPAVQSELASDVKTVQHGGTSKGTTAAVPPPQKQQQSSAALSSITEVQGYRHAPAYFSDKYVRRALSERQTSTAASWGSWTFKDPSPSTRLSPDQFELLVKGYPNRDIPRSAFPKNAWQVDEAYLKPWLEQGIALTERTIKTILAEYGHFDPDRDHAKSMDEIMADEDETKNAYMFNLTMMTGFGYPFKRPYGNAGFASPSALRVMQRLLMHSIVTQDHFFITMGGHSSAAAHGNHFAQSYTLQIQQALEPVLARLGVFHLARNIGMGGLGTVHNAMGAQSIYGGDNAILIWDSAM
jgi:hypothetical protein